VTGSIIIQNLFKTNNNLYSEYVIFKGLDNVYPVNYNFCVDEYIIKPYENYKNIEKEFQPISTC
jgi:hypothetical protein